MPDTPKPWYKVLKPNGAARYTGWTGYDLPTRNADGTWTPGAWTRPLPATACVMCVTGYHLTQEPGHWQDCEYDWSADKYVYDSIYLAEPADPKPIDEKVEDADRGHKALFTSVRLLQLVTTEPWHIHLQTQRNADDV